jgi:hypothetical protein
MSAPSVHTSTGPFGVIPLSVATSVEVQALSHRALRLYLVLLARHNAKRDGWSWSMAGLARDTGIHRDHIPDAVRRLESAGLVEVHRGAGLTCTHYRLLIPPSLRREGATVAPTHLGEGATVAPTVGAKSAPSPAKVTHESAPTEGATVAPGEGATVAPTLQRIYTEPTTEPPYPHSDQNRPEPSNPPSPPASRGGQEASRFPLPERMRDVKRPAGAWQHRASKPAPEVPIARTETACAADLVRQVARDLGVRPREARKHLERQDAAAVERERTERHGPAPTLTVDEEILREMKELYGWEH